LGAPRGKITHTIIPPQQNTGEKDIFVKTKIMHDKKYVFTAQNAPFIRKHILNELLGSWDVQKTRFHDKKFEIFQISSLKK